jgi:hypothetical protein
VTESFSVIGRNDADPPDIIEFDVGDDIFIVFSFAFSEYPCDSAADDAAKATMSSAFSESAAGGGLSLFANQSSLCLLIRLMNMGGYLQVLIQIKIEVILCLLGVADAVVSSSLH